MSILLQRFDQIVEVEKIWNSEGTCNNPKCRSTIYWCNAVINRHTKKKLPLNKKYTHGEIPDAHRCMKEKPPEIYLANHFYTDMVILEKDNWMVVAEKKKRQRKLMGWDYLKTLTRSTVPQSWYAYSFNY
jgi:hypothetical protein